MYGEITLVSLDVMVSLVPSLRSSLRVNDPKAVNEAATGIADGMNTRGREGVLIGVGAGLMLVLLLVFQSFIGAGLLRARIVTSTVTATSSAPLAENAFVIFHQQESACGFMRYPWGVTIENKTSNETLVQPPNGLGEIRTMLPGEQAGTGYNVNASTITVLLSNGEYTYTLLPLGLGGRNHTTGAVAVNGASVVVQFPNNFCPP